MSGGRAADRPLHARQDDLEREANRDIKVPKGGLSPLAQTTYEYSHLRRECCRKAVSDGVRAEVDGRLLDPQDHRSGRTLRSRGVGGLSLLRPSATGPAVLDNAGLLR